jgi:hypothetical protein
MSLSELPRTDRLLWSIVLVTAALVSLATWLLLPPEKTGDLMKQPSTLFNVSYGTRAAYLVLDRLEYPVGQLRRPIASETLDGIGCLFILKPVTGLQDYEMVELEAWVRQGHSLVVVPGWSTLDAFRTKSQAASESETSECDTRSGTCSKCDKQRSTRSEFERKRGDCFENWFNVDEGSADCAETPQTAVEGDRPDLGMKLDASEPICAGIRDLTTDSSRRFDATSPLKGPLANMPTDAFWRDKRGTVGLRVQVGDGTIVALADTYPLTNLGIGDADNGLLLGNIVRELFRRSPGKIAFDEYHLGFAQRDWSALAMTKLMLTGPWQWAVMQAALVGILALYAGAVRFGSPRDITRKPRRQPREFAEAAGRLLDEAGATSLAVETLGRYYRERICRALHVEPEADDTRLLQAVRDRSGAEIATVFHQAQIAMSRAVRRQDLLTLAQKLHRVTETLDHGS